MKQLYKSNTNKKVAGVCGGIGEYLGIDPTIVRLGFVALSLCRNVRHVPAPQMILSICEKNAVGFLLCNLKKH